MKKTLITAICSVFAAAALSAQVLPKQMLKNTTWMGFGNPYVGNTMFYGLTNTIQGRADIQKVTLEGMLNVGFLANYDNNGDVDNFVLGASNQNPLNLHYGRYANGGKSSENSCSINGYSNAVNSQNTIQDSYYVNFIWHISKYFDLGGGTKLNWQVGPSPIYGAWLWEPGAHSRQGGFSTAYDDRAGAWMTTSTDESGTYKFNVDRPGSADVVGFVPYANKYAKRAIAVRFKYENKNLNLELGAATPNGFNTDHPAVNFGAKLAPLDWLSVGAAIEGAFDKKANFYTGLSLAFKYFGVDAYFAADSLFTSEEDDVAYGTGAAVTFKIPHTKITLRPEIGFNFFENSNYTNSFFTGAALDLPIVDRFSVNFWGSFAAGSKDKRWSDSKVTEDWNGGHIINLKPGVKFIINDKFSIDAYANFEFRKAFDGTNRNCWSSGAFLTCLF